MSTTEHSEPETGPDTEDGAEADEPRLITDTDLDPFEGFAAAEAPKDAKPIVTVDNLRMYFPVKSNGIIHRTVGNVQAVDGVSFEVLEGGSLGPGGASRSGKSTNRPPLTRV